MTLSLGNFSLDLSHQRWRDQGFRAYIAGISGSGKTNLVAVFLEELHRLGVPWLVIDPMGDYVSLQALGNVVICGKTGELGLTYPRNDWVVNVLRRFWAGESAVVDLSGLAALSDRRVAFTWLVEQFLKTQRERRRPMFLIAEEAQMFAPQKRQQDVAALELMDELARRGRRAGVNLILASQRPRDLEADVATQCNIHFVGNLESKLDYEQVKHLLYVPQGNGRKPPAPRGLVSTRVDKEPTLYDLMHLGAGQFYVRMGSKLHRVAVRKRETEHIGATPVIQLRFGS